MSVVVKKLSVPFDKVGNMLHCDRFGDAEYVEYDSTFQGWFRFYSILQYSSNVAIFKDRMDRMFYMSQGELVRVIPFMVEGVLEGEFYFHKQGNYFSLRYKDA